MSNLNWSEWERSRLIRSSAQAGADFMEAKAGGRHRHLSHHVHVAIERRATLALNPARGISDTAQTVESLHYVAILSGSSRSYSVLTTW